MKKDFSAFFMPIFENLCIYVENLAAFLFFSQFFSPFSKKKR